MGYHFQMALSGLEVHWCWSALHRKKKHAEVKSNVEVHMKKKLMIYIYIYEIIKCSCREFLH